MVLLFFKLEVNVGIIIDVIVIVGVKFILLVVRICRNFYSNKKNDLQ